MAECIFCEIVAGRSPVSTFYEDNQVLGLMTIGPVTEGHAMVIPKRHAAYLAELDEATGRHLWTVTQRAGDGEWIVFQSDRLAAPTTDQARVNQMLQNLEIWIVRRDGTGLRRLTSNTYFDAHPSW